MIVEQIYTSCLAQAAYYIESNGEVAIIDPLRDYKPYMDKATANNAKIKYIFETHFHADFVSGHIDLAAATGATIVYGPTTKTNYPVHVAQHNEEFKLGNLTIKLLHTPGHTPESSCFLLTDENGKEHCVFTGDTLFVGDVGRPDLLDGILSKEELAGMMFESLKVLKALNPETIVYPAHGAGSACGKNIGKETHSTIGAQLENNYALQPMSKEDFIKAVTEGIAPAPAYFFKDAALNKQGYAAFDEVSSKGLTGIGIKEFKTLMAEPNTVIIDTRFPDFFENGFIPGSLNFGLNGQYAIWAATILDLKTPILLLAKPGTEQESVDRLTRVGFDNILGYLKGGFDSWLNNTNNYDMVISISSEEVVLESLHNKNAVILDVRKPSEYGNCHLDRAINLELAGLNQNIEKLDKTTETIIYCGGGYRSMIAASMLKKQGFKNVKNVWGGWASIKDEEKAIIIKPAEKA